jgi:hypothetical protein
MAETSLGFIDEDESEDAIGEDILSFIKAAAALMIDTRDTTGYFETSSFKALLATNFNWVKSGGVRGIKFEAIIEASGMMVAIDAIVPSENELFEACSTPVTQVQ